MSGDDDRIPATGERFEARLVEDDLGVLRLLQVRPRVDYLLAAVLKIGWRIVSATPIERALLDAHGFGSADSMKVRW